MYNKASISSIETQCRGAVSLVPLYFSINNGQVYTQSDDPLRTILYHILGQLSRVDDRLQVLSTPEVKADVVDALFDTDVRPLVDGDEPRVVEMLDPKEKARLLAHGIAGSIAFSTRLLRLSVDAITPDILQHELSAFALSSQLDSIRFLMERSPLFSNCLMTSQIIDLIADASHDVGLSVHPRGVSFQDYEVDTFSSGYERPDRNMGLPWGFTFMVLN